MGSWKDFSALLIIRKVNWNLSELWPHAGKSGHCLKNLKITNAGDNMEKMEAS